MIASVEAAAVDIPLEAAHAILQAARRKAEELRVQVSMAVVDSGGNLKAFDRMDGAEVGGPILAPDKAFTALANRMATHELAKMAQPGGPLFGLHSCAGGRYVIFGGGIPIVLEGHVIGAVGVSGAEVHEDVACAEAAVSEAKRVLSER